MHGKKPPESLHDVFPEQVRHHLIAISTQECLGSIANSLTYESKEIWEDQVKAHFGEEYLMIRG
jgi:hypothetical protein